MKRLQDKAIIVTGSTMGIGAAIARRCAAEGASVLIHGLEREAGERVAAELGDAAALWIEDVAAPGAPDRIVAAAVGAFGRIDALVNNAGIVATGNIGTTDQALFDKVMAINARAPLFLIQAALPHLEKSRGCVLNIGSVNAYSGEEDLLPYSMAKGALMTMSRNLGDHLFRERGVRVNQINPGWVLTEKEQERRLSWGFEDGWDARLPKLFAPAGRILRPEEIAAAAAYWLSDEAGPISGQVVELEQHPFIGRNPNKELEPL
ncbi:MAG: SDR family oxidoreductase [Verrucomicrobiales bacterium]